VPNQLCTIQTILCVFISIQLTFWKHYSHFGGCETPLDLCWCQTNRANLPCKEIQIRQKAFNNVLHYGGKGLVYHCFVVFHNCLMARLPNTLQVATELTERCFVEHKIVSVLKSDFFFRNDTWCALLCILAAILWVLNPRLHTILVQPGKLRVLAVLAHMSSFKSTSGWENLGWLPSLWPKQGSSIEISECIQLIFVQHTPNMPMFKPGLRSMPIYIQKQQVERLDGNIAMWLVFDASISPSTHDFFSPGFSGILIGTSHVRNDDFGSQTLLAYDLLRPLICRPSVPCKHLLRHFAIKIFIAHATCRN